MASPNSSFKLSNVEAIDLSKSSNPINTGIGYFDHMLDQLNSHAQVGISVTVSKANENGNNNDNGSNNIEDRNRYSNPPELQEDLMTQVGSAIGMEISKLIPSTATKSRFCCPLDEALVECNLVFDTTSSAGDGSGTLASFSLYPYGIFPKNGRTQIGTMLTAPLETFFRSLAKTSGLQISLVKLRGHNGHHVVESAFKAFSRALRNLIDGTNIDSDIDSDVGNMAKMWGINSESYKEGIVLNRLGKSSRATKETSIDVELGIDGGAKEISIDTGVETLNDFYESLAKEAQISLNVKCKGDTWVDDHHTTEDVSIAIGKVLNTSLGTKAGLNRMWCAEAKVGESTVRVTMDLSNRPCLTHDLCLSTCGEEYVGDMSIEMLDHVLDSLVMNAQMTVHIEEKAKGENMMDLTMATAKAFGRALRLCAAVDPRRAGKTASSKGTLSA
mmetsp:Transcript_16415/g.20059  ORF Transcript_16415/g.20059 Transcript_16415/m.20059 type:complete len:444 (-) Transcript_16415:195-1526(-)